MGFELGRENGLRVSGGEVKTKLRFTKDHVSVPGTPIIRKDLGKGIAGEANMDGSIYLDKSIQLDSHEERKVLIHEMRHATDMKIGKLKYEDDYIKYNGATYERKEIEGEDMIRYDGEWIQAGNTELPWEFEANNGNK